jgi:hypothetical protein
MSLDHVYNVLNREGPFYTAAYFLALPVLVFVQVLGCGKTPFDPRLIDGCFFRGYLPTDLPTYEEYLEILSYVYKSKCTVLEVEVRDALYA